MHGHPQPTSTSTSTFRTFHFRATLTTLTSALHRFHAHQPTTKQPTPTTSQLTRTFTPEQRGRLSVLTWWVSFYMWSYIQGTASVAAEHEFLASVFLRRIASTRRSLLLGFVLRSVLLFLVPSHSVLSSFLCLDSTWSVLWLWSGVVRRGLRRLRSRRVLAFSALVSRCDFPSLVIRGARRAGGAWDWFLYLVPIEPGRASLQRSLAEELPSSSTDAPVFGLD